MICRRFDRKPNLADFSPLWKVLWFVLESAWPKTREKVRTSKQQLATGTIRRLPFAKKKGCSSKATSQQKNPDNVLPTRRGGSTTLRSFALSLQLSPCMLRSSSLSPPSPAQLSLRSLSVSIARWSSYALPPRGSYPQAEGAGTRYRQNYQHQPQRQAVDPSREMIT